MLIGFSDPVEISGGGIGEDSIALASIAYARSDGSGRWNSFFFTRS